MPITGANNIFWKEQKLQTNFNVITGSIESLSGLFLKILITC